jgi:hypothetical protein
LVRCGCSPYPGPFRFGHVGSWQQQKTHKKLANALKSDHQIKAALDPEAHIGDLKV